MTLPENILIVGSGIFGLSTTLTLATRHPQTQITLLDASPTIPNPHGSSVDASRIVRADYAKPAYTNLAAQAIDRWRHTDWGREGRYTQNGLLLVYPPGAERSREYLRESYENVRRLYGVGNGDGSRDTKAEYLPSKEDVLRVVPEYGRELNVEAGYVNWGSGWSDAEKAVMFAREKVGELERAGRVIVRTGVEVEGLLVSDDDDDDNNNNNENDGKDDGKKEGKGKVTGVHLKNNNTTIPADLTILATGAWTPKLIDLRSKAIATGQIIAFLHISDEEQARLADMPTVLNFATGIFVIPPRNNLLKVARHAYGYHNPKRVSVPVPVPVPVDAAGSASASASMEVSLPEPGVPIPREGEVAVRAALRELLPSFAERPFVQTRVCWYTDTPKGDFIISYHPTLSNLFLATGGSGHAYKFFPVIGEKVVDALEGRLEPELRDLWTWSADEPVVDVGAAIATEDGSRSGVKGLRLLEELAKGRKERRGSVL